MNKYFWITSKTNQEVANKEKKVKTKLKLSPLNEQIIRNTAQKVSAIEAIKSSTDEARSPTKSPTLSARDDGIVESFSNKLSSSFPTTSQEISAPLVNIPPFMRQNKAVKVQPKPNPQSVSKTSTSLSVVAYLSTSVKK